MVGASAFNSIRLLCFQGKFYKRLLFAVFYLLGFSLAIYLRPRHLDPKRIETRDDKVRRFFLFVNYRVGSILILQKKITKPEVQQ